MSICHWKKPENLGISLDPNMRETQKPKRNHGNIRTGGKSWRFQKKGGQNEKRVQEKTSIDHRSLE